MTTKFCTILRVHEPETSHPLLTVPFPPDQHQPAQVFITNYTVNKMTRSVERTQRSTWVQWTEHA